MHTIKRQLTLEQTRPRGWRDFLSAQRDCCRRFFLMSLCFAVAWALWSVLSHFVFGPFLIPPPAKVASMFYVMLISGELVHHAFVSLGRIVVGFSAGAGLAIFLGLLMGRIRIINEFLEPVIEFARFLSPTAMIPIAVVWFGIGEQSKYFLIFWGTLFIVLINTIAGVVRVPKSRVNALLCLGAGEIQIFRLVIFPSAVPIIVTGMRVALAAAFMSIVPAELLAAESGLGYLLQSSSLLLQTDRMFVALITIGVVGFVADRLFRLLILVRFQRFMAVEQ